MIGTIDAWFDQIVDFVHAHEAWAAPIVFCLAFGESLAFISLLIPAWGALVAIGYLIGPSHISFWPVCIAGALGAALGDWLSYWIGVRVGPSVAHMWPLSRHPDLLPSGERFMKRWGVPGIFIGRFFGPLRASVPLVAGILVMPYWRFQIANFTSALVWSAVLLTLGDVAAKIVTWFMEVRGMQPIVLAIVYAVVTAVFAFQLWSVVRTGHVRWRVQKVHRAHRPLAFAIEIVACALGLVLFAGLLVATLLRH